VQASATAEAEPPSQFKLVACKADGDSATADVVLSGDAGERRERHTLRRLKDRWLFERAAAS
jgi:hypothetical protein